MLTWCPPRRSQIANTLLSDFADGAIKLFVTSELLRLRNERPELFELGYEAMDAGQLCIAFARADERERPCWLAFQSRF